MQRDAVNEIRRFVKYLQTEVEVSDMIELFSIEVSFVVCISPSV